MPSFLAGQRLQAAQLNAFTAISTTVSGGPTSGTTELVLTGSLVIPAAPVDRIATPWARMQVSGSVAGDRFVSYLADDALTARHGRFYFLITAIATSIDFKGDVFTIPANTGYTLAATLQRINGTGDATLAGGSLSNDIGVSFEAAI